MAAKYALADERVAVCTICSQRKRVHLGSRWEDGSNEQPGFSPIQSRCLPFERRCIDCTVRYRQALGSITLRRLPDVRQDRLWAAAEGGAMHAVLDLVLASSKSKVGVTHCLRAVGEFDPARGYTALHCALLSSAEVYMQAVDGPNLRFEVVSALLEAGCNPNSGTILGRDRPIKMASALGDRRLVEALLTHGANPLVVDSLGSTALHHARGSDVCRALIREGCKTDVKDKLGRSPYLVAIEAGDKETAKFFEKLAERRIHEAEVYARYDAEAEKARREVLDRARGLKLGDGAVLTAEETVENAAEEYRRWRANKPIVYEAPELTRSDVYYHELIEKKLAAKAAAKEVTESAARKGGQLAVIEGAQPAKAAGAATTNEEKEGDALAQAALRQKRVHGKQLRTLDGQSAFQSPVPVGNSSRKGSAAIMASLKPMPSVPAKPQPIRMAAMRAELARAEASMQQAAAYGAAGAAKRATMFTDMDSTRVIKEVGTV